MVNSRDALIALTSTVGIDISSFGFNTSSADVDRDGTLTTRDALFIMSWAIGIDATGSATGNPLDATCTPAAAPAGMAVRP